MADLERWCTEDDPCPDCAAGREVDGCWAAGYWVEHPYDRPGPPFRFTPLKIPERGELIERLRGKRGRG